METLTHKIIVDEYTEVSLKIPEIMTPIEFKLVVMKANKIFNISDVPINSNETTIKSKSSLFTPHLKNRLYQLREVEKKDWSTIEKELNIERKKCQGHITYLERINKWNKDLLSEIEKPVKKKIANGLIFWTPKMEETLYQLKVIEKKSWKDVSESMKKYGNISTGKLMSKFGNMKTIRDGEKYKELERKFGGENK